MKYQLNGRLHTAICDGHEQAISNTKVRLYSLQREVNEVTAYTAAQSKEIIQVFDEKEIKARKKELLAEAVTDENGNYEFKFDGDKTDYNGGVIAITLFYDNVPDYGQKDTKLPKRFVVFEVLMDVIHPKWTETNNGLTAAWNYRVLKRVWCYILARLDIWVICGTLTNCKSQAPLKGIEVIAMDDDIITDDLLGSAVTNNAGKFCIYYRSIDFKKTFLSPWINLETTPIFSFDNGPDIYFKFALGGSEFFSESPSEAQKPSRKNVGNCLCVNLCLDDIQGEVPGIPVAFYEIGYNRNYHPILNIDPSTGRTTGKLNANWNEQAFFSTIELRGSLNQKFNGQPAEYKFQYAEVINSTTPVGSIPASSWNDVQDTDIAQTQIAKRIFDDDLNKAHSYSIHGSGLTDLDGVTDFDVTFNGSWIQVPQYSPGPTDFPINFTNALIKLKTGNLGILPSNDPSAKTEDKSGLIPGSTSAPLEKNRYFALRMWKREAGNPASEAIAGFSRPLAIFNTLYDNVLQGGSWSPTSSKEFGIATVDLQQLTGPGNGCNNISNAITVNYTAANPNLGNVGITFSGQGATNNFEPIVFPSPGEEAFGTSNYLGDFSLLQPCAYEIRLNAELNLTNGETQHQGIWDRVLFCR